MYAETAPKNTQKVLMNVKTVLKNVQKPLTKTGALLKIAKSNLERSCKRLKCSKSMKFFKKALIKRFRMLTDTQKAHAGLFHA
jgi:hypothetical protein